MQIIIGARGSALSLIQAEIVKEQLLQLHKKLTVEIVVIETQGDRDMSPVPLDSIGKGWFTKEIDKALLEGRIDLAVHSLKDIPEKLPEGLMIAAIPNREDAREALVSFGNIPMARLRKGALIGTDSLRRKAQILYKRPDLIVRSIRGNVNTRLQKLDKGIYDAIFLAVAGLRRLGLEHRVTEYFALTDVVPSPGQGALALVIQKENSKVRNFLQKINHKETAAQVRAERAFSGAFGGGCKIPVGAYAACHGKKLTLYGMVGSRDGKHIVKGSLQGDITAPVALGNKLARQLLQKSRPWFFKKKYIVLTRPEEVDTEFRKRVEQTGYKLLSYPTIRIRTSKITAEIRQTVQNLASFDWLIFTSSNGIRYFIKLLHDFKIPLSVLGTVKIAAVGTKTAEEINRYGLTVSFIPAQFTANDLAHQLPKVHGKRICIPKAAIASPFLAKQLKDW